MAGETRRVAEFISGTGFRDLPAEVVHATKRFILDHLGIAVLGAASVPGVAVVDTVRRWGGTEESTVIGQARRYPSLLAPLANGTMAYSQMTDDLYPGRAHIHPGNCVIPAVLALAEAAGADGRHLIAAIAVGYEVGCRVADATGRSHADMRFYEGSANPHFGALAGAAKAMELDTETCCHALGLVGSMASGIWEDGVIQSTAQPLHAGKAAANGVLAATLARNGLAAGDTIFEGRREGTGYLNVFSRDSGHEHLVDGLGTVYRMLGTGFKFHAGAGGIQPSVDAVIALRSKHGICPDDVEAITVRGNRIEMFNHNNPDPQNTFAAVQSSYYCVSRALIDGHLRVADMEPRHLVEPRVRELMAKVNIELDPDHDKTLVTPPYLVSVTVVVRMKDGRTYEETVASARGTAHNPATDRDLEAKFHDNVSGVLPQDRADAVRDAVWGLEDLSDVGELAALLRP